MALIHKKTFEIIQNIGIAGRKQYFECDDMIAETIRLLNLKGYKTVFSCAGHPFDTISEGIVYSNYGSYSNQSVLAGVIESKARKDGALKVVFKSKNDTGIYISFDTPLDVPDDIPDFMQFSDGNVQCWIQDPGKTTFDYLKELLDLNEKLYRWAEQLPDNTKKQEEEE